MAAIDRPELIRAAGSAAKTGRHCHPGAEATAWPGGPREHFKTEREP